MVFGGRVRATSMASWSTPPVVALTARPAHSSRGLGSPQGLRTFSKMKQKAPSLYGQTARESATLEAASSST